MNKLSAAFGPGEGSLAKVKNSWTATTSTEGRKKVARLNGVQALPSSALLMSYFATSDRFLRSSTTNAAKAIPKRTFVRITLTLLTPWTARPDSLSCSDVSIKATSKSRALCDFVCVCVFASRALLNLFIIKACILFRLMRFPREISIRNNSEDYSSLRTNSCWQEFLWNYSNLSHYYYLLLDITWMPWNAVDSPRSASASLI